MEDFPFDWDAPEWSLEDRVHNWRNYASDDLRIIWQTFTTHQKKVISAMLEDHASREDWD